MTSAEKRGTGQPGQPGQARLFAYCAGSGMVATSAATVSGLATTGTARIVVWAAVLGSASVAAGIIYLSRPMLAARLARRAAQRAWTRA
jgi:hypothetical protein